MFGLDKIGLASMAAVGVANVAPASQWQDYLEGGGLVVVSTVLIIFALKVFPMLINKLSEQSKAFAESQVSCSKNIADGQKAQASAIEKLADAFNALAIRCAVSQAEKHD